MVFSRATVIAEADTQYRIASIPKGNGKFREIYIASPNYNKRLRDLLPRLESIAASSDLCKANYAFEKGKNCALNALQHIGYRYTLSMDLENFFDSVTPNHVKGLLCDSLLEQCFIDGHPRQGLPTSPLIATIAFFACDAKIKSLCAKLGIQAIYTRYADDLVFSFNDRSASGKIQFIVRQTIARFGFTLNSRKTKLQDAKNGSRIVTGLAIDQNGIHATRRTRRKIRAAMHQQNSRNLLGLEEWAKCKLPRSL